MAEINDVSPVSSNTNITSPSGNGYPPFQSVNGRMLTLAQTPDASAVFAGSFSNVWKSLDDGETWDQVTWQQPQSGQFTVPGALGGWCVIDIALSPVDPQTILAITRNDHANSDHGIWRSTDGGSSWTRVYQFSVAGSTRPPAAGQLAWPIGNGRLVYAAGGSALAISRDGGASFQEDPRVGPINHVAVFPPVPTAPLAPVYALGKGVMFVSLDGGGNWTPDGGPIHRNWGGGVASGGNAQAPSVLVVSPRSPLEVFLVANANGGRTVSPLANAFLFASVYHSQHHFGYPDIAGTIWDSWWDGDNWNLQQINAPGGKTPDGPAAVDGPFVTVYHNTHHFAYPDIAGTIWDSWWDGDNWNLQQINAPGGKTPDGPAAVDGPFVTVYHDQHHFAYLDAVGTIWDSWWDGDTWQLQQINGGPVLWRGDYGQFRNTGKSTWQRVVPPDLNEQGQDSGRVFIAATRTGNGDLLFYGAQRTKLYVGPLDPASASDWKQLDDGNDVHPDLHGIFLSLDFRGTIHNSKYQWEQGTLWLLCDGGVYRSTDGGRHFKETDNLRTLACVNVAGVAVEGKTALSLNTGDNDGFFSKNGGEKWISQDYGGGDNDCSFADPLRPNSMLVFTPRWDPDGNSVSAAKGRTVTVYESSPGNLPDLTLGTDSRHVVPGPSLSDRWNATSTFGLRGYRPIVFNLLEDDSSLPGDYIFIRFKSKPSEAVLLRTQKLLEIDSRDDWDTVATGPSDGARVFQQGPALPSADMGVVQASGGHTRTVFYVGGNTNNELWKFSGGRTGGPAASEAPFVTVYHNTHHFAYPDIAGTIWDSWWDGDNWNLQQINAPGGKTPDGPAAVDGPFVTVYHNQHHFTYRDSAGTIWDSWWDGDNWQLQQINAPGGKTPDGPAAVDGPFVTVYHDQHHFAYLDAVGTIWDSWWDGDTWQLQQINGGLWQKVVPSIDATQARRFFVSPYNTNLVYILDVKHIRRSDDGGKSWQVDASLEKQLTGANAIPIDQEPIDFIDLVLTDMQFDPINPQRRFAVGKGGVFFTNDGANWDRLLDTVALPGRPTNCYYDSVSDLSSRALYVATGERSLLKISPLP
jgi:hypothetical protein